MRNVIWLATLCVIAAAALVAYRADRSYSMQIEAQSHYALPDASAVDALYSVDATADAAPAVDAAGN